jgi:hypothetical protein
MDDAIWPILIILIPIWATLAALTSTAYIQICRTDLRLDAIDHRIATLENLIGSGPASPSRSSPDQPSEEPVTSGPSSAAAEVKAPSSLEELLSWGQEAQERWLAVQQARDLHNPSRNPPAS